MADRRCFVIARVSGESGSHRIRCYVNHGEPSGVAAGDERYDRSEVLPQRAQDLPAGPQWLSVDDLSG